MALSKTAYLVLAFTLLASFCCSSLGWQVAHDDRAITIDGERRILISGAIHYARSTPDMWPNLIQKAKEGGLDAIETYVFWNAHEPRRREYNFEGSLDLVRFIQEIQNAGMYAVLRIGPYVCAEWNYGGLPVWLHQIPGMEVRTDNQKFKDEMQTFTSLIVDMMKKADLMALQGGPIILAQIENEYGNIEGPFGAAGKRYINWCAEMAESLDIGVPWIMCQQKDAPAPMIETCNGFACDGYSPRNKSSPKMWTENWTGWFRSWDRPEPHRPAENVAFAVARFFQLHGTFQNYYMYHGGTNFGRSSGGPYITTSYDYDAPLDEYGNPRQPKWGHLKELHFAIKKMEKVLAYGQLESTRIANNVWMANYSGEGLVSGCFLANKHESKDAHVDYNGYEYFLPAYSVSILPECKEEVYNTAKVTTQTSIMVKKPNHAEKEPEQLRWYWRPESLGPTVDDMTAGSEVSGPVVEQKMMTGDASDYLWYMASVDLTEEANMTLKVDTQGHLLYAFVNGQLVGSHTAQTGPYKFTFEHHGVSLKTGQNKIVLLSGTVGLPNYGAHYDMDPVGIVSVKLLQENATLVDITNHTWSYKTGMDGEDKKLYLDTSLDSPAWISGGFPINTPFTWYKTAFQAPLGSDPVVVDLKGLGKGMAWVNGNSLGRYWPSHLANTHSCQKCDYRGPYQQDDDRCRTGCGEPTQRWYHVPRSFLNAGEPNVLILFEEAGGDPDQVNFQTVVVGTVCGNVEQGKSLTLSCEGQKISAVEFASFGNPTGECGSFSKGDCDVPNALSAIEELCVGKLSCTIGADELALGDGNSCSNDNKNKKRLAVQAVCG